MNRLCLTTPKKEIYTTYLVSEAVMIPREIPMSSPEVSHGRLPEFRWKRYVGLYQGYQVSGIVRLEEHFAPIKVPYVPISTGLRTRVCALARASESDLG